MIIYFNGAIIMTVRERVFALRLLEKQKKNPKLAKKMGINVQIKKKIKN